MSSELAKLLGLDSTSRAGVTPEPALLRPGTVSKVNTVTGDVWVTPDDGDGRTPLGPCLGATEPAVVPNGQSFALVHVPLSQGLRVLVTSTATGTWIVAVHHPTA